MDNNRTNPFEGMKRRRLPGMHMMTALEGGMPLREALAAHFFVMLHEKVQHNCLIKQAQESVKDNTLGAIKNASSADGMTLAHVFGIMDLSGFAAEEWSYLPDEEVYIF